MSKSDVIARDDFFTVVVASAVHELLTPLAVVAGFADLLRERWDDGDPDELRAMVDSIARSAERMKRLAGELIETAQAHRSSVTREITEVDVHDLLSAASQPAVAHRVDVEVRCPPGMVIRTDVDRVEQIVAMLVDNARVHGRPPITISAEPMPSGISIVVRDNGPGVPAELLQHLFQPFGRGRGEANGTTGTHRTHGLGLYTGRCAARRLDGDLNYESSETGAFILTLPQ